MTQIYSRIFSSTTIINLITNSRLAQTLFGNGWIRFIPVNAFFLTLIFANGILFCSAQDKGQASDVQSLSGKWLIQEAEVLENNQKVSAITKENCLWVDHVNLQKPLVITNDGRVTYSVDQKPVNAMVKIENNSLIFYFPQNGNVIKRSDKGDAGSGMDNFTSTAYHYSVQGRQLVLTREDPEFSEKYIFKRQ